MTTWNARWREARTLDATDEQLAELRKMADQEAEHAGRVLKMQDAGAPESGIAEYRQKHGVTDEAMKFERGVSGAVLNTPYMSQIGQSATFGVGDEILGGVRSLTSGRPYADVKAEEEEAAHRQRAQTGTWGNLALDLTGAAIPALMTGGATLLPRVGAALARVGIGGAPTVANALRTGAITGSASGAAQGAGDAPSMRQVPGAMAKGGLIGLGVGSAAGVAGNAIARGLGTVARKGEDAGLAMIRRAFKRGEVTPAEAADHLERIMDIAPDSFDAMAVDVAGPANRQLMVDGVAQMPGAQQTRFVKRIGESLRSAPERIENAVDDLLGTRGTTRGGTIEDLIRRRSQQGDAYKAVEALTSPAWGGAPGSIAQGSGSVSDDGARLIQESFLKEMNSPHGKRVWNEVLPDIQTDFGIQGDATAAMIAEKAPFMVRLMAWSSKAAEMARALPTGDGTKHSLNNMRGRVLGVLDRVLKTERKTNPTLPDYKTVRAATRTAYDEERALNRGYQILGKGAESVREAVKDARKIGGDALESLRIGYRARLVERIASTSNPQTSARQLGQKRFRDELRALGVNSDAADTYIERLDLELGRMDLAREMGNSKTSLRQAIRQELGEDVSFLTDVAEEGGTFLRDYGRGVGLGGAIFNTLGRNAPRITERVARGRAEGIGRTLQETNPAALRNALRTRPEVLGGMGPLAPMMPMGAVSAENSRRRGM